jgi:hypothetical protein
MNLIDIIDNTKTDKNTTHSYIRLYENLLNKKKETAKNILEIGIDRGGSIKLWSEYFTNAIIYGLDIMDINDVWDGIKNKNNIILYTSLNAYDPIFVNNIFMNKIKFDFMLDDGPHTLESQKIFINNYFKKLNKNGKLIIEDVLGDFNLNELLKEANKFSSNIKILDLRDTTKTEDSIIIEIQNDLDAHYLVA